MIWHATGWALAVFLLGSLAYSIRFHLRNYARMKLRDDPLSRRLRSQYLRNVLLQQAFKAALIAVVVYWLAGNSESQSSQNRGQVFADAVLRAVFTQSERYKLDVRPLFATDATDEDRQLAFRRWANSLDELIHSLSSLDKSNVAAALAAKAEHILDKARQLRPYLEMESFLVEPGRSVESADELGKACMDFEQQARSDGLILWSQAE